MLPLKQQMLETLPFSNSELDVLIETAPFRYKEYKIPKREIGKFRNISQPTPEVKLLQRWVVENVLNEFPIHLAATAYRPKQGLLENIRPHQNNRYLLKIDFKDFFPSITAANFKEFLSGSRFSDFEVHILSNILFKLDKQSRVLRLAIGAPSSPTLSNLILFRLDEAISKLCEEKNVSYTRYADDLSFSTNERDILGGLERCLPEIISQYKLVDLVINPEKTRHASKKNGRRVTGLNITSEQKISIGRERKHLLRAQIFKFSKGDLSEDEVESLKGFIAFLRSVEPEHIERIKRSYGEALFARLIA